MERAVPPLSVDMPDGATPADQSRPLRRGWRSPWTVVAVALALALGALALWRFSADGPQPLTGADVNRAVKQGIDRARQEERTTPPDAAVAYRAIRPSLVTITTSPAAGGGGSAGADGRGQGSVRLGAGVVINAAGAVLTALHVVEGSEQIRVRFADGTRASARILRRDPANDIAVLANDRLPELVVPAVIGGGAQVGDAVFAVGNPLGLADSLTAGVVSAVDRSVPAEGGRTIQRLIQFDAAVNPGSSGGPLLNRDGQVIGIVTGLANPSQQAFFVGLGFAVPIATAGGAAGGPHQ